MNETNVKSCDSVCEKPKVHKIGEILKFVLDDYGTLYPYNDNAYFKEGFKIIECEIKNVCNIKVELEYPVRNIYEENA